MFNKLYRLLFGKNTKKEIIKEYKSKIKIYIGFFLMLIDRYNDLKTDHEQDELETQFRIESSVLKDRMDILKDHILLNTNLYDPELICLSFLSILFFIEQHQIDDSSFGFGSFDDIVKLYVKITGPSPEITRFIMQMDLRGKNELADELNNLLTNRFKVV